MRLNLIFGLALVGAAWGLPVLAHGVEIEHRQVSSVELEARYDSGEPMANAQVLVYAPSSPTEAWQQGTTDDQGRFSFVPDAAQPGNWEVTVRLAGHGTVTTIPVSAKLAASGSGDGSGDAPAPVAGGEPIASSIISPSTNLSPVQRGITIGAVIWGFIGTALFFARGKR